MGFLWAPSGATPRARFDTSATLTEAVVSRDWNPQKPLALALSSLVKPSCRWFPPRSLRVLRVSVVNTDPNPVASVCVAKRA